MADYTTREVTVTRVEYLVPFGPVGELHKALAAAEADYRRRHGLPDVASIFDDWCRVDARDDEIVISFTMEKVAR